MLGGSGGARNKGCCGMIDANICIDLALSTSFTWLCSSTSIGTEM